MLKLRTMRFRHSASGTEIPRILVILISLAVSGLFATRSTSASNGPPQHPAGITSDAHRDQCLNEDVGPVVGRFKVDYSIQQSVICRGEELGVLHLNEILSRKLTAAQWAHQLHADEVKKLTLAGQGDIKRFVEQVSDLHWRNQEHGIPADQVAQFKADLVAVARRASREDYFGSNSLFEKTLKNMATSAHRAPNLKRDAVYLKTLQTSIQIQLMSENPLRADQNEPLRQLLQRNMQSSPVLYYYEPQQIWRRLNAITDEDFRNALDAPQVQILRSKLEQLDRN